MASSKMVSEPKLSKSQYVKGLQCPKGLWFYRNRKDLAPEIDDKKQALFDTGNEVGELAKRYFGGGAEVTEAYWDVKGAAATTTRLVAEGEQVIFEATAIHPTDGSYSRIDALRKVPGADEWDMIEVKSSTSVKDYHIDDMSFQYHVFYHAGFRIRACYMMLIDNAFIRNGEIDPQNLLKLENISQLVFAKQDEVQYMAAQLGYVLERKDEPEAKIGARCFSPFECDYRAHCWKHVPAYSIYNVFPKKKADEIAGRYGTFDVGKLPAEVMPAGNKAVDVASYLSGEVHIQADPIRDFIGALQYPLYFLDYETILPAIPLFDGTRPYQQVPFQFSLHVQDEPGGALRHYEFLHRERSDPRPAFTESLVALCGDAGSVISYNAAFEAGCNEALAQAYPHHAEALAAINARMVDLLIPFRNRWLYHPAQQGSASIKAVLPAFTELSYDGLAIANGGEASLQYEMFIRGNPVENSLWDNLGVYCKQDTYAMVVLLNYLKEKQ